MRELVRRPDHAGAFYISDHIALEVLVRLSKRARTGGRRERRGYEAALERYRIDRDQYFNTVTVESGAVAGAEEIAVRYNDSGAGTLDLLHAASAWRVQETLPGEPLIFVVSDRKLRNLVARVGFHVFNPERHACGSAGSGLLVLAAQQEKPLGDWTLPPGQRTLDLASRFFWRQPTPNLASFPREGL